MLGEKRIINLGEFGEVVIEPKNLEFNEASLSRYLEQEAGWYDYFGTKLADAEYILARLTDLHDVKYSCWFKIEKSENKASDALAEARANSVAEVVELAKAITDAKHNVKLIQQHLRSWDRNHENVQNRGNTLRKEMDRLSPTIYGSVDRATTSNRDAEVEEMFAKKYRGESE